jgi:DNA-binding IclR family transcriptional regulator
MIYSEEAWSETELRGVDSVDRALALLNCCAESTESLGLSALSKRTGLYKSTALRLMGSLRRAGLIEQMPDKSYRLGQAVMKLAAAYQRNDSLEERIRPVLRRLVESTGESASLHRRDGDQRLCVFRENSPQGLRDHVLEGSRQAIKLGGASSHVLSSFSDKVCTHVSLEAVRSLPACSIGQPNAGVFAVAMPVFNRTNRVEGVLAVSGPTVRLNKRKLMNIAVIVVEAASEVSIALGAPECPLTTLQRPNRAAIERVFAALP